MVRRKQSDSKEHNHPMPEVTSHAHGSPSWADLSTTDEAAALSFYGALFGWADDPQEMGPDSYYHMQKVNGRYACAIYRQGEQERSQNVPSHWNIYITVNDVEEAAAAIRKGGGQVVFGPMDVFEAGRMAMCQDPQGAFFAVWQAKEHIGAGIKGETGAMFWHELLTTDRAGAVEFYTAAFGLEGFQVPESNLDYVMLRNEGTEVAGVLQITPEMGEFPPHWSVYFGVDSADATVEKARSLGATVYVPPTDIVPVEGSPPIGRFSSLADPQGASFSIFQPA